METPRHDRLTELFERALELSPEARGRFIDTCSEAPAIRSELKSLLAAYEKTPDLLERLAGEVVPAVLKAVEEDFVNADETSPRPAGMSRPNFGPYCILEELGEGGMGVVYLAEQEVPLRRRVAIKVIKVGMDTRQVIARFEAERQALAVMDHPAIATVFDGGATDDGRPYFAMEYVRGEPITKYCDRQRLTTNERLELFLQICDGVQHAHQKGIIHRDLKPSNVLVTVQDDRAVPKIIDFGVAKATAQSLTDHSLLTEVGVIIGTPEYMSPEQAEMRGLDIDTRTDVYALGVILYELLTGTLPFGRDTVRKVALDDVRGTTQKEAPRPSARIKERGAASAVAAERRRTEPRRLASRLRGDLDTITLKALERDRAHRYQTANGLAMDVRRYLRNEPVSAQPPSTLYRMQRFIRRHRVGAAAAAALLVALVLGVAGTTLGLARARHAEVQAREDAAIASRVSEFLVTLFEVSDPGEARGNSITAREILERGAEQIRRDLGDQPQVQARLIYTMGKVHDSLGLYNAAAALLEEALKKREALFGPEHPDVAESCERLGDVYQRQGRHAEAEPLLRRAVAIREKRFPANAPLIADSLTSLGNLYQRMGRLDEAQPVLDRALAIRERNEGNDAGGLARTLNAVAVLMARRGQIAKAEPYFLRALAIEERTMGRDHPDVGRTSTNLANVYMVQKRFAEAEPLYARALEIRRRTLGPRHANVAETLHNIGSLYMDDHRPEAAEPVFREALSIYQQAYGATHRNIGLALDNLGKILVRQHRYKDAEAHYRQALAILEKTLSVDDPYVAETLQDLGELYHELKRPADAEPLFRRSLAIRERMLGFDNIATADSMYALGVVLRDEGRAAEALPLIERAFAIRMRELKEGDRDRVDVTRDYARVLRALGRRAEADAVQALGDGPTR
jgi:non-specific serine/threonine protein kinase/serine/threonine-protein kinase